MRIVVTGGSGRLGQHVIGELLAHGHDVLSLDRASLPNAPCASWIANLTRIGDLYQAFRGAHGVIHLAAYQAPGLTSDSETFGNNVTATYNVCKAATDLEIRCIVLASSVAAYGYIYAPRPGTPAYLPVDERHPCRPTDPYGLSKIVSEQIGDSFAALGGTRIVSARLPGINFDLSYASFPARWESPGSQRAVGGFWSYVDARDAATFCRLAVQAAPEGHTVLNAAAPNSLMPDATRDLIARHLPELVDVRGPVAGNWSGLDSSRAFDLLGWSVQHPWERYLRSTGHE